MEVLHGKAGCVLFDESHTAPAAPAAAVDAAKVVPLPVLLLGWGEGMADLDTDTDIWVGEEALTEKVGTVVHGSPGLPPLGVPPLGVTPLGVPPLGVPTVAPAWSMQPDLKAL
jgi:hypothetical protein